MYRAKKEIITEYYQAGDCILVHWSALGDDTHILGFSENNDLTAISLSDGCRFTIAKDFGARGVTMKQIVNATGGMEVEYLGKIDLTALKYKKCIKEE